MPVESVASAAPFNHLIPTVWHIYNVHTHTQMHLLLRGSKKGLFLWGAESAERIANYCPLGHTQ